MRLVGLSRRVYPKEASWRVQNAWRKLLKAHPKEVCDAWKVFTTFYADMGESPKRSRLVRPDPNSPFGPGNAVWEKIAGERADKDEPDTGPVPPNRAKYIEVNGVRKKTSEWAEELGISRKTLNKRRGLGWTDEEIVQRENARKEIGSALLRTDAPTYEFNGETMTLAEWSLRTGIQHRALYRRLKRGWSIERTLTEPFHDRPKRRKPESQT